MGRLKKILFASGIVFVLYSAGGFLIAPPVLKTTMVKRLSEMLHREVAIRQVRVNPYVLSLKIRGLSVEDREKSGLFLSCDELYVNFQSLSLLRWAVIVEALEIRNPYLNIVRTERKAFNFSDLAHGGHDNGKFRSSRFCLSNFTLSNGSIDFFDRFKKVECRIKDFFLTVPLFSSLPEHALVDVRPGLSATVNGTSVRLLGRLRPFVPTFDTVLNFDVHGLNLTPYLAYVPLDLEYKVIKGLADLKGELSYMRKRKNVDALSLHGNLSLSAFEAIDKKGRPLMNLPSLVIDLARWDFVTKEVHMRELTLAKPEIHLVRERNGKFNLAALLPQKKGGSDPVRESMTRDGLHIRVDEVEVRNGIVHCLDRREPASFRTTPDPVNLRISNLSSEKKAFFTAPILSIKESTVNVPEKRVAIGKLFSEGGKLSIERSSKGSTNVLELFPPSGSPAAKEGREGKGWDVFVEEAVVDQYSVRFRDLTPPRPVSLVLDKIHMNLKDLSNEKDTEGTISLAMKVPEKGTLSIGGRVGINPLSANLRVEVKECDVKSFEPYWAERLRTSVKEGVFSTSGSLRLFLGEERGLTAKFQGEASVSDFSSLDMVRVEDFFKWKSLYMNGVSLQYNPTRINIDGIALTDFSSHLRIDEKGRLNLQDLIKKVRSKDKTTSQGKSDGKRRGFFRHPVQGIEIETVTLQGGEIRFSDRYIRPNFSATLREVGGRISGLTSRETMMADVSLKGKLNGYAPLNIIGKMNPLREDPFVDLDIKFRNVDLTPMAPYAGKYMGYTIEKGKLFLETNYVIVSTRLNSRNRILLDQFTLGDPVDSPHATRLPVALAVALLKNRNGEIELELPVNGRLDDPEFSLGRVTLKIVTNVMERILTCPFAFLGAIFGGGEKLSYVEFRAGSSDLSPVEEENLDKLVHILYERPGLRLEIEGHVDILADEEALRGRILERKLKAQKLEENLKKGMPTASLDAVEIRPGEYEKYLTMVYEEEDFPKPRGKRGTIKRLSPSEMEKLILSHIQIPKHDLRMLARSRAVNVRSYLLKSGKVKPERIFLVEPKFLAPQRKENVRESRVDFRLK